MGYPACIVTKSFEPCLCPTTYPTYNCTNPNIVGTLCLCIDSTDDDNLFPFGVFYFAFFLITFSFGACCMYLFIDKETPKVGIPLKTSYETV